MGVVTLPTMRELNFDDLYRPSISLRNELKLRSGMQFTYEQGPKRYTCVMVDDETFRLVREEVSFGKRKPYL